MQITEEEVRAQKMTPSGSGSGEVLKKKIHAQSEKHNIYPIALMSGLAAGLFMGGYLIILQILGIDNTIALKFLKYVILFSVLGWGLAQYRQMHTGKGFFQNGILLGVLTTVIGGGILIAVNLVSSLLIPDWAFNKYNLIVNSTQSFLVASGAIFFEVLVFGIICTFIWLQYLKGSTQPKSSAP